LGPSERTNSILNIHLQRACMVGTALTLFVFSYAHVDSRGFIISPASHDDGENPALDGWTELDGSFARLFSGSDSPPASRRSVQTSTCTRETNLVMPRHGDVNNSMFREYTVTPSSFQQSNSLKVCATVDKLLSAVKDGHREWTGGRADEKVPSTFVAAGCRIPHYEPTHVKEILSKPSKVSVFGDSLTRHMIVGVTLLQSGNYVDGGLFKADPQWKNCICDGQFSESLVCRSLLNIPVHDDTSKTKHSEYILTNRSCREDSSPRVFWLQGGAHFHSKPYKAVKDLFVRHVIGIRQEHRNSKCPGHPIIFISGLNSQSRSLDQPFPEQTRERAAFFNEKLAQAVADPWLTSNNEIHMVDFMNLTLDAQTSDGYHYLTDVNIVKADVFVGLVDMVHREWRFSSTISR